MGRAFRLGGFTATVTAGVGLLLFISWPQLEEYRHAFNGRDAPAGRLDSSYGGTIVSMADKWVRGLFGAPFAIALVTLGQWAHAVGTRLGTVGAIEQLRRDRRRPLLLLRAFKADAPPTTEAVRTALAKVPDDLALEDVSGRGLVSKAAARLSSADPEQDIEHLLVEHLRHLGPLIAIGRPGEVVPTCGAARLYVPDDSWREVVGRIATESSLVIVRAGENGRGLTWELKELRRMLSPERVVLLVSNAPESAREIVRDLGAAIPPPFEHRHFVLFGPDWVARPPSSAPSLESAAAELTLEVEPDSAERHAALLRDLEHLGSDGRPYGVMARLLARCFVASLALGLVALVLGLVGAVAFLLRLFRGPLEQMLTLHGQTIVFLLLLGYLMHRHVVRPRYPHS